MAQNRLPGFGRHPYTSILWSSLCEKRSGEAFRQARSSAAESWGTYDLERPTVGCRFAPRCPVREARGRPAVCTDPAIEPQLLADRTGHRVACHFPLA